MTYFELFQESPALFFLVIVISLVVTLLVYGAFPVIFSKTRKTPITKKKYKGLCYGSTGNMNFVGCGSDACPYCQGASMLKSKYKGPYSFPYYSSISNTRNFFETTTVIFAEISVFLVALSVLPKIKKNKS